MKTNLEFGERMTVSQILPKEGAYLTVLIAKRIIKKLEITDKEIAEWDVKMEEKTPGIISYVWNPLKVKSVEFEFSDAETDLLRRELNKLDTEKKLNFGNISVFEKFCNPTPA